MGVGTTFAIVVVAGALVVGAVVRGLHRRKVRVDLLYRAAIAGDRDLLARTIRRTRSVDRRDAEGNTALHLAYYHGEQEAIDALTAFGADENLRNKEHLLPIEMREVATIEGLLTDGARCLGSYGDWRDAERGRLVYDRLKGRKPRIFNPALVRGVLSGVRQTQLVHLAIKLGIFGSEEKLVTVLRGYGTAALATNYLNSGSAVLREAAEVWARRNNYTITYTPGARSLSWGRF